MATNRVFIVFVLPVILSVALGAAVMGDILQQPGRQLDILPASLLEGSQPSHGGDDSMRILGLFRQYSVSEPVQISVRVDAGPPPPDSAAPACGDLYVTIYHGGTSDVAVQEGFFGQCLEAGGATVLPAGGEAFSAVIGSPGPYDVVVELITDDLKDISARGAFTVK